MAALTADLRAARRTCVVATDEEGGDVTRLDARDGQPVPRATRRSAPSTTRRSPSAVAARSARALAAVGVDLDLAPVVDVNSQAATTR